MAKLFLNYGDSGERAGLLPQYCTQLTLCACIGWPLGALIYAVGSNTNGSGWWGWSMCLLAAGSLSAIASFTTAVVGFYRYPRLRRLPRMIVCCLIAGVIVLMTAGVLGFLTLAEIY